MGVLTTTAGVVVFEGEIDGALPPGWSLVPPSTVDIGGDTLKGASRVEAAVLQVAACLILSGSFDPSADGGTSATPGSLYLRNTGEVWAKTGETDTDWTRIAIP